MPRRPGLRRMTADWADSQKGRLEGGSSKLIMVEAAVQVAGFADRAKSENDQRLFLASLRLMQQLIKDVERDSRDGSSDDVGAGDAWADEMARLVGSPPSLGNATDSL